MSAKTFRLVAVIVLGLLVGSISGAPAVAGSSVVREAIVSTLAADGSVQKTTVAQLLHLAADSGGGDVELRIPEVDDLSSYRNLSGFRGPSGEGEDLVWRTSDRLDARSLTDANADLPISVRLKYFLDGKQIDAEELKRRSGEVRIEVDLENVSGDPKTLEYKAVTAPFLTSVVNQYIPIEYAVRVEFPIDRWSDVGGEGIRVAADGEREVASASGILSPPLTPASKTLTFEARSDDVLTPRIQIFAIPGLSKDFLDALQAQYEGLQALYGGVGTIGENLNAVYEGTLALVDGVEDMIGGVGTNDSDGNPVINLGSDGLPTTLLGTLGFLEDAMSTKILPGIGEVDEKTGEGVVVKDEKGKTTTLLGALQSQKDTYDEQLIPGMKTLIDGVAALTKGVEDNAPALVDGLTQIEDGLSLVLLGLQSGDPADPGFVEGLQALSGGITTLLSSLQTNSSSTPGFREGLLAISTGLSQLLAGLQTDDPANPGFREGLLGLSGGLTALLANLQTNDPGNPGLREGLLGIQQAATDGAAASTDPVADAFFAGIVSGISDLLTSVGDSADPPSDTTVIGAVQLMSAGVTQLLGGLGDDSDPPSGTTIIGAVQLMIGGVGQLVAGLGDTANPPDQVTVIGALKTMQAGMGQLQAGLGDVNAPANQTTVIGALKLLLGGLQQAGPGAGTLVTAVLDALGQIEGGLTNPQFTKEQDELDGQTPKEYFADCPGCFDPDSDIFDPATADPRFQPRFLQVFELFSEGIEAALPALRSHDEDAPGLVDGLEQIAGGLDTLAQALHTHDADDPGLVDGLELVRGGLQQVSAGIFALNELGIRTMRGTVGDRGDTVARDQASLSDRAASVGKASALGAEADVVSATYVFDLAAQTTASNDNLRRGAILALALLGSILLSRRMRRFDL